MRFKMSTICHATSGFCITALHGLLSKNIFDNEIILPSLKMALYCDKSRPPA